MRLLGLVEGDAFRAMSGVAALLFQALRRRSCAVEVIDYAPARVTRLAVAAGTFRPNRATWRARFHTSRLSHHVLSRLLARRAARIEGSFDVALQVHGWALGQPRPYALYVDQTRLMADRGWPDWLPLTAREREKILSLEREMYAGASHTFTMGEPARESLIADYDVASERITVVGGGLRFEELPPTRALSPDLNILFVGREFERKGGEVLVRAFDLVRREQPHATLHIVGPRETFDLPGVVNHGKISDLADLEQLYRRARAFVLPSLYEPYGLVLIEAMAFGVPCVGTAVQSIPEILDHGRAGTLVPPDDPEALAEALVELLSDYETAQRIGVAGRQWVARSLTWDHVAGRMLPVLSALAEAR